MTKRMKPPTGDPDGRGSRGRTREGASLSPRNLGYMRSFAAAWPDRQIVQQVAAKIPWFHSVVLLDKVKDAGTRLWYARKAHEEGWSRNVLAMQIEARLHERTGRAITSFPATPTRPDAGSTPCGEERANGRRRHDGRPSTGEGRRAIRGMD